MFGWFGWLSPFSLLFERGDHESDSGPARSWIFAAGDAGREGDGRGARRSVVNSWPSLGVSFVEFGLVPVFGVMPMERNPPPLARSAWWSPVTSSALLPWWWRRGDDVSGASSLNKRVVFVPRIWRKASRFSRFLQAVAVMERELGRSGHLKMSDRVRAQQQQLLRWGSWRLLWRSMAGCRRHSAASSGRRAAISIPPGLVAIWEAVLRSGGRHGWLLWLPRRPKWSRPRRWRGVSAENDVDLIAFSIFRLRSFLQKS